MSGEGKFKLEQTGRRPLRTYLEIIGPFITNSRLDYQAALSIFWQYFEGTLLGSVEVLFKMQAPFETIWDMLTRTKGYTRIEKKSRKRQWGMW